MVQAELKAMVEMGVIEESNSAWCSLIVLVGKKDGSIRFCVDYRKVNEVSRFDAYPAYPTAGRSMCSRWLRYLSH